MSEFETVTLTVVTRKELVSYVKHHMYQIVTNKLLSSSPHSYKITETGPPSEEDTKDVSKDCKERERPFRVGTKVVIDEIQAREIDGRPDCRGKEGVVVGIRHGFPCSVRVSFKLPLDTPDEGRFEQYDERTEIIFCFAPVELRKKNQKPKPKLDLAAMAAKIRGHHHEASKNRRNATRGKVSTANSRAAKSSAGKRRR